MALLISNAILHILNNNGQECRFSNEELDVDSETCSEFIGRHVRRLIHTATAREATFSAGSQVYQIVKGYQRGELHFREMAFQICRRLAELMQDNGDIPSGDILVAAFDSAKKRYIAIVKFTYGECFTHRVLEGENQIVKNTAVLPMSTAKVEEACLIPYDPMVLRIIEKPYMIGGEITNYWSQLFLECDAEGLSKKETSKLIQEIADEVTATCFNDDPDVAARTRCAILDEASEADDEGEVEALNLENVARRAFRDHPNAAEKFIDLTKQAGLPFEVDLDRTFVSRELKTLRFKADNGIEVKYPLELSQNPEVMQIITNPDGSVSITLKNLHRHQPV